MIFFSNRCSLVSIRNVFKNIKIWFQTLEQQCRYTNVLNLLIYSFLKTERSKWNLVAEQHREPRSSTVAPRADTDPSPAPNLHVQTQETVSLRQESQKKASHTSMPSQSQTLPHSSAQTPRVHPPPEEEPPAQIDLSIKLKFLSCRWGPSIVKQFTNFDLFTLLCFSQPSTQVSIPLVCECRLCCDAKLLVAPHCRTKIQGAELGPHLGRGDGRFRGGDG